MHPSIMVKARVGARLKVAVGGKIGKGEELFVHPELVLLTKSYKQFSKQLQNLITHVKAHGKALDTLSRTRVAVANGVAILSRDSPLYDWTASFTHFQGGGGGDDENDNDADNTDSDNFHSTEIKTGSDHRGYESSRNAQDNLEDSEGLSYQSVHYEFAKTSQQHHAQYVKKVVDYAVQWEKVVTTRISADLKTAEQLRVELVHYQSKVDTLRQQVDSVLAKGKRPKDDLSDKLERNTEKLKDGRDSYEAFTDNLCSLLEEVVKRSWRDLHPLLLELATVDIQYSTDQAQVMQKLETMVQHVQRIGKEHGVTVSRLKDLETKHPKELLTTSGNLSTTASEENGNDNDNDNDNDDDQYNKKNGREIQSSKATKDTWKVNVSSMPVLNKNSSATQSSEDMDPDIPVAVVVSEDPQLYIACATGDSAWLRHFLRAPMNANAMNDKDDGGMFPLGIAARCGHADCVKLLLDHGAYVDIKDNTGCTPLHHASETGSVDCVQMLLDYHAKVEEVDGEGFTPFHTACEHGHFDVLNVLMEHGAAIDSPNPEGWRPIHLAAQNGRYDCLVFLTEHGAKVQKVNDEKWTALHLAAANGFNDCIKVLIEQGAPVDDTDRSGSTPLQKATEKGHVDCVRRLLKYKADPNRLDQEGYTPLIASALEGNVECMKLLLTYKADVNKAHPDGWTPLHLAADYGYGECIQLLLQYKADINSRNEDGWTALHKAAEQGHVDCLEKLLDNGADLEGANNDGFTSLHVAAFNGHANCIELLLDRLAKIDQKDTNGCTPLYWAASEGQLECAKVLVQRGANPRAVDRDGKTPVEVAMENGHRDCAEILRG